MFRVGTYGSHQMLVSRMNQTQANINTLQKQMTTEVKADKYAGFSWQASTLITLENERDQANRYIEVNHTLSVRLQTADAAVEDAKNTITEFRNLLRDFSNKEASATEADVRSIRDRAFEALKSLEMALNSKVSGEYLFGGGNTSTPPVDFSAFSSSEDFGKVYSIDGGDPPLRSFPQTRKNYLDDPDHYYKGDTTVLEQRVDQNRSIQMDVNALDPAFEKSIRAMGMIAQNWTAESYDQDMIDQAMALLNSAIEHSPAHFQDIPGSEVDARTYSDLRSVQQRIGMNYKTVDDSITRNTAFAGQLDIRVTEIKAVNMPEVAAKLQAATLALEISFAAMAQNKQLSLVNYI